MGRRSTVFYESREADVAQLLEDAKREGERLKALIDAADAAPAFTTETEDAPSLEELLELAGLLERPAMVFVCPACDVRLECEDELRAHYAALHMSSKSWKQLSGRAEGSDAYEYGDLTRAALHWINLERRSWKMLSGRTTGVDSYQFGDLTLSAVNACRRALRDSTIFNSSSSSSSSSSWWTRDTSPEPPHTPAL